MQKTHTISTEPDVTSSRRTDRAADLQDWNRDASRTIAAREGLTLTEDHWAVIDFLRAYYLEQGTPPSARDVADALNEKFAAHGGRQFLYRLFPAGPVTQGSRIAMVTVPPYSEDDSFGTAF